MKRYPHIAALSVTALVLLSGCDDADRQQTTAQDLGTGPVACSALDELGAAESASCIPDDELEPTGLDEPVDVVRAVLTAYETADVDVACALQTQRYVAAEISAAVAEGSLEPGASCADLVTRGAEFADAYGLDAAEAAYEEISNDGRRAVVDVNWPEATAGAPSRLVLIDAGDGWQIDAQRGQDPASGHSSPNSLM